MRNHHFAVLFAPSIETDKVEWQPVIYLCEYF